jgi:hypothetical protein
MDKELQYVQEIRKRNTERDPKIRGGSWKDD